jgi:hypothetical protein
MMSVSNSRVAMTSAGRHLQIAAIVLAIVYFQGLVIGGLWLLHAWFFNKVPQWPLWQFIVAPLGVGLATMALELLFLPLTKITEKWHFPAAPWKKVAILGVLILLILGYVFLWPCDC